MKMVKNTNNAYKISGMDCVSCAMLIESELEDAGVNAKVSYAKQTLEVSDGTDIKKIRKITTRLGYKLES